MQLRQLGFSVGLIELVLDLFDQRQHVAHTEDALRHPIRIERLKRVILLADANEFHRLPDHLLDRERRTAAGIAIHLGKYDTGYADPSMKLFRRSYRVLSGHRIRHEQNFRRMRFAFNLHQLFHQLIVDVQTSGRIDQKRVIADVARLLQSFAR